MLASMFHYLANSNRILKPRRRWMQFSLGTLFAGVTGLCLWLACSVDQARRQRTAVAELHKLHIAVMYGAPPTDRRGGRWKELLLGATYREPVEYIGFQHARGLLEEREQVEQALALLADLPGLKRLSLEGVPVTDKDIVWLKPLATLQKLNLRYTDITAAGVADLQRALPDCEIVQ
jgi:hypothetical protein